MSIEAMALTPNIIKESSRGYEAIRIEDELLQSREIFFTGVVQSDSMEAVLKQLIYLYRADPEKEITMYINSPGGSVTAGLAIYDTMQYVKCDVQTICMGQAASMGAILLAGGTVGKRYALPSSRVMIHQPWGGAQGQASDIAIQAKEIGRLKKLSIKYFSQQTGKSEADVAADMERDFYMDADEAKAYGIIDHIMVSAKKGEKK